MPLSNPFFSILIEPFKAYPMLMKPKRSQIALDQPWHPVPCVHLMYADT